MPRESRVIYPQRAKTRRPFPKAALIIFLGAFTALLIGAGLWYLLNVPYFRVGQIEIRGAGLIPAEELKPAVREAISGQRWFFVPRNNFFIVSGEEIRHKLSARFTRIETIEVSRRFPNRLIITIKERTLWGVYCQREGKETVQSCFYLDTGGTAYETFSRYEGWLLPVVFSDKGVKLGEPALGPELLRFFDAAKGELNGLGQNLISATLSTTTPDDIRLGLTEGWELRVTASRPVGEWLGVLKTVLEQEIGERRRGLSYIDLRFGNKVFYKFK